MDLARDARALGQRGGVGLVGARVFKLAVLLAQVDDLVLKVVLQGVELAFKSNGATATPRERHRAGHQGEKHHRRTGRHASSPRPHNAARRQRQRPARTKAGQVVAGKRQRHPRVRHQRGKRARNAAQGLGSSRPAPVRKLEAGARAHGGEQRHHAHGIHLAVQHHKGQAGEKHHALVGNSLHSRNYTDATQFSAPPADSRAKP